MKFTDALDARPCFYGGTVQRICDFIEAFQILHGDASDAVRDMRYARQMQAALLETVPRPVETRPEERVQGIWRPPSRLLGVDQVGTSDSNALRDDGKPHNDTWFANRLAQRAEFGNAAMSGAVIPWLGVQLEGKTLPLSLRNGPAVVLDFWSDAKVHIADAMKRLSVFMAQRIEGGAFLPGPLHVIGRRGRSVRPVAAVLPSSDMHYLVVFCGADELPDIDKSIAEMKRLVRENADWGLVPSDRWRECKCGAETVSLQRWTVSRSSSLSAS